jgi:hypothetical protein
MLNQNGSNTLDVRKFYETLARIIGEREGVEIKVVAIREREPEDAGQLSQHTA